ncbi:MAG: PAS domain S-box protein [Magnetococcales bacterium]|nr:PAS domain S-box protein [Magnetococcales bacterium]
MIKHLPFSKKLGLFFLLMLLAFVMNAAQAFWHFQVNKAAWRQEHDTRRVADIIHQVEQDADHAEAAVEVFLRTRDDARGEYALTLLRGIEAQLQDLARLPEAPAPESIGAFAAGVVSQAKLVTQIRGYMQEIGANENSGEHGLIRNRIHQVEELLRQKREFELLASMLQLRRHEKDLMDRQDVLYLAKFNNEVEYFQELLNSNEQLTDEEKKSTWDLFRQYNQGFYAIASALLAVRKRVDEFRTGIPQVDAAMQGLVNELDRIYREHDLRQNNLLFISFVRSQVIIIFFLLLIGGFLAWSQYDILRAIEGLSLLARRVARGEQPEIVVDRRDEIGELTHSIKVMQASLLERHRLLTGKVGELEASEQRYAAVIRLADYAIFTLDADARIHTWNRSAEMVFGQGEFAGRGVAEWVDRESLPEWEGALAVVRESGQTRRLGEEGRFLCRRANGERFPATVSLAGWELEGKGHFTVILRDIGERVANRRQVERALDLRSAIAEILQASLQPTSLEEILRRALRVVLSISWLGLKRSGAIFLYDASRERLEMVVHQSLDPQVVELCQSVPLGHCLCGRAAAAGEVVMSNCLDDRHDISFDGMTPHGHYCVPIVSPHGMLGVLNVYLPEGHPCDEEDEAQFLRSIADTLAGLISRRQAERRITQLSRALEQSPVSFLITDPAGLVEYVNPRFSGMTGYAPGEVLGRNILDLKGEAGSLEREAMERVLRCGGEWAGEARGRKKGGEEYWELISLSPVFDTDGRIINHVFVGEEITEKKDLERARDRLLTTLDAMVEERTRQLDRKIAELESTRHELIESEKMASLGRLVAGIAHEVNTPIGVAYSASTQMRDESLEIVRLLDQEEVDVDELVRAVKIMDDASLLVVRNLQRAAELINSFKRASIDQASEAVRDYSVLEVVRDVQMSMRNWLKKSAITVEVTCPEDPRVVGVPGYLHQILTNLMQNSYTHGFAQGSVPGSIRLGFALEGTQLRFDYQDSGAGMAEETRRQAFEPFFTTNRSAGGSGLGLYICYNLITTKLRGAITLASAPGEGVRFVCHWPVEIRRAEGK